MKQTRLEITRDLLVEAYQRGDEGFGIKQLAEAVSARIGGGWLLQDTVRKEADMLRLAGVVNFERSGKGTRRFV
jgi:hypothetical protein